MQPATRWTSTTSIPRTYNTIDVSENDITSSTVHRIRLSYDNLSDGMVPTLTRATGKDADGNITTEEIVPAANVGTVSYHASPSAYELVAQNPDKVYFIPETGEMLLGEKCLPDDVSL